MTVTSIRQPNESYEIDYEEALFVCIFKDLTTNKFGLHFTAPSEVFGVYLQDSLIAGMGVGGCLSKDNAEQLICFLQDYVDGRI